MIHSLIHPSVFILSGSVSLAEDGRADSDDRRALFDGRLEVVAHAHRKLARGVAERAATAQFVAQGAQASEVWARSLGLLEEGREHHQPSTADALATLQGLEERGQLFRARAAL